MKYLNTVVLACFVFFSSVTAALDLSIKKNGHSVRIKDGAVSIDTPDAKVQVGKQPSNAIDTANPNPNVSVDRIDPIVHENYKDIEFTNVQQRDLEITLGGSGSITVTGKVENLVVTNNGSGNLELENLIVEKAFIKVNASGSANVNVSRELKAEITGSGDINYKGNPARVIPKLNGSGSVNKR